MATVEHSAERDNLNDEASVNDKASVNDEANLNAEANLNDGTNVNAEANSDAGATAEERPFRAAFAGKKSRALAPVGDEVQILRPVVTTQTIGHGVSITTRVWLRM
jgi:hypothetical protein